MWGGLSDDDFSRSVVEPNAGAHVTYGWLWLLPSGKIVGHELERIPDTSSMAWVFINSCPIAPAHPPRARTAPRISAHTRADSKHDVHGHLLLCAISLQVWTHLQALGVEVVSQPSPQVFPYHSHQAQRW
ncbi:hypothetical protein BS47DRAFT_1350318 [Hydnum rufescens UP504]|uniref:Uncharacterized protein n=1 Tax=Hydnum rufescens UP504 TaxID=1448309 RepID=A0A9P6AMK2_9AGAM|nr:hypothetical protein BS47DRAFT_1350318 [Hydnum rufescens UP504]